MPHPLSTHSLATATQHQPEGGELSLSHPPYNTSPAVQHGDLGGWVIGTGFTMPLTASPSPSPITIKASPLMGSISTWGGALSLPNLPQDSSPAGTCIGRDCGALGAVEPNPYVPTAPPHFHGFSLGAGGHFFSPTPSDHPQYMLQCTAPGAPIHQPLGSHS